MGIHDRIDKPFVCCLVVITELEVDSGEEGDDDFKTPPPKPSIYTSPPVKKDRIESNYVCDHTSIAMKVYIQCP